MHGKEGVSQAEIAKSIAPSPEPPVNAATAVDTFAWEDEMVRRYYSGGNLTAPRKAPMIWTNFETLPDLDVPFEMLDSTVGSSNSTTKHGGSTKHMRSAQEDVPNDGIAKEEDRLNPQSQGYSGRQDNSRERIRLPDAWEDIQAQTQRYKTHDWTTTTHHVSHKDGWSDNSHWYKRKFSAVDTPSTAEMVFEPLTEDRQGTSKCIKSEDFPPVAPSDKYSELFTDSWPSSLENALKQWTNLTQNEIDMDIPRLITVSI